MNDEDDYNIQCVMIMMIDNDEYDNDIYYNDWNNKERESCNLIKK